MFCFCSLPQVADAGISVTIMCPGYVNTNLSLNAMRADGGKYGKMVSQNQHTSARERIPDHLRSCMNSLTHSLASLVLMLLLCCSFVLCQDSSTAGGYEAEYVAALSYAALRQRIPEVVVADLSARKRNEQKTQTCEQPPNSSRKHKGRASAATLSFSNFYHHNENTEN